MMRYAIYLCIIALAILHQDVWFWDDRRLLLGFLPIGLAYHALFSVCAATVWALAVKFAWPSTVEDIERAGDPAPGDGAEVTE